MKPNMRPVRCDWCGNRYPPCGSDKQGVDCAASVFQREGSWILVGNYGSDHDMSIFDFRAGFDPTKPSDPVCDHCINEHVRAGVLVQRAEMVNDVIVGGLDLPQEFVDSLLSGDD